MLAVVIIPIIMKRTEVKKANVHQFDIEELACRILGIDYDEIDADTEIINEELYNQFETDLDNFQDIVNRLLPLIDVGESPITKEKYKGFSTGNSWLAKVPVGGFKFLAQFFGFKLYRFISRIFAPNFE